MVVERQNFTFSVQGRRSRWTWGPGGPVGQQSHPLLDFDRKISKTVYIKISKGLKLLLVPMDFKPPTDHVCRYFCICHGYRLVLSNDNMLVLVI